jgi:hypothetical protein
MPIVLILPSINPLLSRTTFATYPQDWDLIYILITIAILIILELILVFTCIRIHNLHSKARWKRLRERGVVVVNGPALIWMDNLPLRRGISLFNVRQTAEEEQREGGFEGV